MEQPFKKKIQPFLFVGGVLAIIGYSYTNFVLQNLYRSNPANLFGYFLSSEGVETYLSGFVKYLFSFHLYSVAVAILLFLVSLMIYLKGNDTSVYRMGEEHGSARYARQEEIKKYAYQEEEKNIILTKNARMCIDNKLLPYKYQRNKNIAVIGDSGSGKTFTFVKPNLMQMYGSYVVTDPKGLLLRETGKMLEENGYAVKVLDLNTLSNSNQFNVFQYIKEETDIDRVQEAITEGTKKSGREGEDFWIQAEAIFIRSLIAYLWFDGKWNNYEPTLPMIADMIRLAEAPDEDTPPPIDEWFVELEEHQPGNYASKQWRLFNESFAGETRHSVLAIAASRYSVFDHKDVMTLLSRDTMDIESWNEEKTAVFITIPETNDAYNFIASIFISTIMETLRKKVDKVLSGEWILEDGKELLFVQFILDELANIGRIPNVDKALATFRSRYMGIVIILQALSQLKSMYKDNWASLLNNCASLLFLGGDEEATIKYLSMRAGNQTIMTRNYSESYGRQGSSSMSKQKITRELLKPDEIAKLDGEECLLFITKEHVFRDKKASVLEHSRREELANDYSDPNWYRYKRPMNEVEDLLHEAGVIFDLGEVA